MLYDLRHAEIQQQHTDYRGRIKHIYDADALLHPGTLSVNKIHQNDVILNAE